MPFDVWGGQGLPLLTRLNYYFISGQQKDDPAELDKILAELASIETRLEEVDFDAATEQQGETKHEISAINLIYSKLSGSFSTNFLLLFPHLARCGTGRVGR